MDNVSTTNKTNKNNNKDLSKYFGHLLTHKNILKMEINT